MNNNAPYIRCARPLSFNRRCFKFLIVEQKHIHRISGFYIFIGPELRRFTLHHPEPKTSLNFEKYWCSPRQGNALTSNTMLVTGSLRSISVATACSCPFQHASTAHKFRRQPSTVIDGHNGVLSLLVPHPHRDLVDASVGLGLYKDKDLAWIWPSNRLGMWLSFKLPASIPTFVQLSFFCWSPRSERSTLQAIKVNSCAEIF